MKICTLCGFRYDPAHNQVCQSCPLHVGCRLTRCPACGYEEIDDKKPGAIQKSRTAAPISLSGGAWKRIKAALHSETR